MLEKFLDKFSATGSAASMLGQQANFFHASLTNASIVQGFHIGTVAISIFDLVRILLMLPAAYILNEEIPFTISTTVKSLNAAITLGLVITMVAAPITVPVAGVVFGGIGLAVGAFMLGKTIRERYQLGRAIRQNKKALQIEEHEMETIMDRIGLLQDHIFQAHDKENFTEIYKEIRILEELLQAGYEPQNEQIKYLKIKNLQLNEQIKKVQMPIILVRSIGVGLSATALLGLSLLLVFPLTGLTILAGVSIAGAAYAFVLNVVPALKYLGQLIINKLRSSKTTNDANKDFSSDTHPVLNEASETHSNRNNPLLALGEIPPEGSLNFTEYNDTKEDKDDHCLLLEPILAPTEEEEEEEEEEEGDGPINHL